MYRMRSFELASALDIATGAIVTLLSKLSTQKKRNQMDLLIWPAQAAKHMHLTERVFTIMKQNRNTRTCKESVLQERCHTVLPQARVESLNVAVKSPCFAGENACKRMGIQIQLTFNFPCKMHGDTLQQRAVC